VVSPGQDGPASSSVAMRFEFTTASRIIFGPGSIRELGKLAGELGRHALLVTGRNSERTGPALSLLTGQGTQCTVFSIPGEPTTHRIIEGVRLAEGAGCDLVVAMGGGSAIDAGKAIGALLTNGGELLDYLEVIGRARPLLRPAAPIVAIPTTAGTGCEVTRNAVLLSPEHQFKVSLRSSFLLPRVALVDPELCVSLPSAATAATGLDALTQLIEAFVCLRANPMTDSLCAEGIRRAARSLRRACETPGDVAAREDMALASLWSGIALANAGLGAVHGFAAPLGGIYPAPHGAVCAALLPHVMAANLRALEAAAAGRGIVWRYQQVAEWLTGRPGAEAAEGIRWVDQLCANLGIPRLRIYGVTRQDVPALVEKALQASSMKANPVPLGREDLAGILLAAL
jgi:alcohol dehydrogenase class IV